MNTKVFMWILLFLVIATIAIILFVPRHLDSATGKVSLFKPADDVATTTTASTVLPTA